MTKFRTTVLLVAVLAVVFFSFFPALDNKFVMWDDDVHLYENITVRSLDYEHLRDIFTGTINKIYVPLTAFSFALEYHFFGYKPFIYHLDNVLLHLGVVAFVFWLGLRLGLSPAGGAAAALLFGVHPMHVESVAWVTERKDVLYSFFYMAALLSYCRYLRFTRSTKSFKIKKASRFLVLTAFFGILSMLAKPMALSLPLILVLLDWFYGRKLERGAFLEKLLLAVAIACLVWFTYAAHARIPAKNLVEALLIWPWTFVFYLRQFAFPFILTPVYQLPKPVHILNLEYGTSLIVFGLWVLALARLRRHRWFMFASAFYFLSIFFLLRFDHAKDTNVVADRFMYLPSLGFCFLWGYGWQCLLGRSKRVYAVCGVCLLTVLTVYLSIRTSRQCRAWYDSISIWRHQLAIFPNEPVALNNLAAALREKQEYKDAEGVYRKLVSIQSQGLSARASDDLIDSVRKVDAVRGLYLRAIAENPNFIDSYYNLGNLYRDIGKIPEAVEAYKNTLMLDYSYKDAHFSLGGLYQKAGDYAQAVYAYNQTIASHPKDEDVYAAVISAYTKALRDNPKNAVFQRARLGVLERFTVIIQKKPFKERSYFNLGSLYNEMGDFARAESVYRMVLDRNPNHASAIYNLGNLYKDHGRFSEAIAYYERAVKANPRLSDAFVNMGSVYNRQGNALKAKESFESALKAESRNARAYFNLGYLQESAGDLRGALGLYQKSIELDPENAPAHYNLGNVFARLHKSSEAISSYLRAVKADPDYMDAWINLSILSFKADDFDHAVKYLDEAVFLGYKVPEGYINAIAPYRK